MSGTLKNWSIVLHGTTEDPQPPLSGSRRRLDPGQCNTPLLLLCHFIHLLSSSSCCTFRYCVVNSVICCYICSLTVLVVPFVNVYANSVICCYYLQTPVTSPSSSCCRSATPSVQSTSTQPTRRQPVTSDAMPCVTAVTGPACGVVVRLTPTASTVLFIVVWLKLIAVLMWTQTVVVCLCSSLLLLLLCRSLSSALLVFPSGCGCNDETLPTGHCHNLLSFVSIVDHFRKFVCYTMSQKIRRHVSVITSLDTEWFSELFTGSLSRKFAIHWSLKISPNLRCVATLPCEMLMSEN